MLKNCYRFLNRRILALLRTAYAGNLFPTENDSKGLSRRFLEDGLVTENDPLLGRYVDDLEDTVSNLVVLLTEQIQRSLLSSKLKNPNEPKSVHFETSNSTSKKNERMLTPSSSSKRISNVCFNKVNDSRLPEEVDEALCSVFGPEGREDIVTSVDLESFFARSANVSSGSNLEILYHDVYVKTLYDMELAYMSCIEELRKIYRTGFDLKTYGRNSTGCLKRLAVTADPLLQMTWFKYLPRTLDRISKLLESYKTVKPAKEKINQLIDRNVQNVIDHPDFRWAKAKIDSWRTLGDRDKKDWFKNLHSEDLKNECQPSRPLKILILRKNWDECLRIYLGNLLILETFVQKHNRSLEFTFLSGSANVVVANLVSLVKNVLDSRFMLVLPDSDQFSKLQKQVIECQNILRSHFDEAPGPFDQIYRSDSVNRCLKEVYRIEMRTFGLRNVEKLPAEKQDDLELLKRIQVVFNRLHMESMLYSYAKLHRLNLVLRDVIRNGLPSESDLLQFGPWIVDLLNEWDQREYLDPRLRLTNVFGRAVDLAREYSCEDSKWTEIKSGQCWRRLLGGLLILESAVKRKGLTLQTVFLEDDLFASLVFMANKTLSEFKVNPQRSSSHKEDPGPGDEEIVAIIREYRETAGTLNLVLRFIVEKVFEDSRQILANSDWVNFSSRSFPGSASARGARLFGSIVSGAIAEVAFGKSTPPSTIIGGLLGRVADVMTYPILGNSYSQAVRESVQGTADSVVGSVTGLFGR